jgi:hypothetical protein
MMINIGGDQKVSSNKVERFLGRNHGQSATYPQEHVVAKKKHYIHSFESGLCRNEILDRSGRLMKIKSLFHSKQKYCTNVMHKFQLGIVLSV